jgi:hypothetical protein
MNKINNELICKLRIHRFFKQGKEGIEEDGFGICSIFHFGSMLGCLLFQNLEIYEMTMLICMWELSIFIELN